VSDGSKLASTVSALSLDSSIISDQVYLNKKKSSNLLTTSDY